MSKRYRDSFTTARFHIETGPASLFERVRFKIAPVHKLYLENPHYLLRLQERDIPPGILEAIQAYDCSEWDLISAEVRTDRGKFVNSTWEKEIEGKRYWITIGVGDVVVTIVEKEGSGFGKIIKSGILWEYVREVNEQLMIAEGNDVIISTHS